MSKQHLAHLTDAQRRSATGPLPAATSGTYRRVGIRCVLTRPDPMLARPAAEVDPREPRLVAIADAMVATMHATPGCLGLAAPQVGESVRMFCVDVTGYPSAGSSSGLIVMVNPCIVSRTLDVIMREACLSVPDFTGDVARAASVVVEGFEPGTGKPLRITADAIEARCLQHEIDHLDGLVFVERVRDMSALFAREP